MKRVLGEQRLTQLTVGVTLRFIRPGVNECALPRLQHRERLVVGKVLHQVTRSKKQDPRSSYLPSSKTVDDGAIYGSTFAIIRLRDTSKSMIQVYVGCILSFLTRELE